MKATEDKKDSGQKKANVIQVETVNGLSKDRQMADLSLNPLVRNANTAMQFSQRIFGQLDIGESISVTKEKANKLKGGDLSEVESTLMAQALTLDAMFNEISRMAVANMGGQYMAAFEIYMRLALKAQSQSRSTLETLAEVKYPKAATFVRQQNVAYQQQVNNGESLKQVKETVPAPACEKNINQSNELLEANHGEWLDTGATGATIGNDKKLEAVGKINGRKNNGRKNQV